MPDTTEKIIIEVGLTNSDYVKKAEETTQKIDELRKAQALLKLQGEQGGVQYKANAQALQGLGRELNSYTTLARASGAAEKANADAAQNATLAYTSETGSINELRARLSILTAQRNAMSAADRDATEAGQQLTAETAAITTQLKALEKQTGDTRRNVGNYAEGIKEGLASMVPFGDQILAVYDNLKGLSEGLKEAGADAGGLAGNAGTAASGAQALAGGLGEGSEAAKIFKVALASTGIGLIIVAVAALINYLSGLKPVMDFIERATAGLKAGFETFGRVVFDVGETLVKALLSPVKLIKDIGNFLANPIQGFKDLGSAASQAGKDISEAAVAAAELTRRQQDQDDADRQAIASTAKLRLERDKFAVQAKNISLTEQQRIDLLDKATQKEKEAFAIDQANAKGRLAILKEEEAQFIKRNKTAEASDELQKKIADAQAEVYNQEAASLKFTEKRFNDQAKLQEKAQADAEKAAAAAEKIQKAQNEADKVRLEAILKVNAATGTARQNEQAAIELDIEEKKKKYAKYAATVEALEKERLARLKALNVQYTKADQDTIQKNLDAVADLQASRISDQGDRELMQIALVNQRKIAAQDQLIKDTEDRMKKGEEGLMAILQSQLALRDQILTDQDAALYQKNLDIQEQRRQKEGAVREQEVELVRQATEAKIKIRDEEAKNLEDGFALAEQLFGKETTLGKAAIIAERAFAIQRIIIKTQEALAADRAAEALENVTLAAVPFAGIGLAIANSAKHALARVKTTIAGAISVGTVIATTIAGFKDGVIDFDSDGLGSMVTGAGTGRSDSVNARLSNGESVINAESTKRFKPLLDVINQAGGGRSLYRSGGEIALASGGVFDGGSSIGAFDPAVVQQAIVEGMKGVNIVVGVKDIISGTNTYTQAKVRQNV